MGKSIWASWIWYVCSIHWICGVLLLADPSTQDITAITTINNLIELPHTYQGVLLILISTLTAAMLWLAKVPSWWGFALIMPQQIILMVSAYGAITAISSGQFADGITRSPYFIAAGQSPLIIASMFHTIAIIDYYALGDLNNHA